jgi:hypothetical protein
MEERRKDGDLVERIVRLEMQMGRLVSDAESEKGTRRRVAESIDRRFLVSEERVRQLERTIWMASGTAAGFVALVVFLINLWVKHS